MALYVVVRERINGVANNRYVKDRKTTRDCHTYQLTHNKKTAKVFFNRSTAEHWRDDLLNEHEIVDIITEHEIGLFRSKEMTGKTKKKFI